MRAPTLCVVYPSAYRSLSLAIFPCAGFREMLAHGHDFLLEGTRLKLAAEFLAAMRSKSPHGFGVLFSGPNGVGKSAVGVLTFLACVAQRLPALYIPSAMSWVHAAREGRGDAFFLEQFVRQNAGACWCRESRSVLSCCPIGARPTSAHARHVDRASNAASTIYRASHPRFARADLIVADHRLMDVFLPALRGEEELGNDTMRRMVALLQSDPHLAVGVIVDEVQAITQAVESKSDPGASQKERDTAAYFASGWYNWASTPGTQFVRMEIASSHGKLPAHVQ